MTTAPDETIRRLLDEAIASVPHAEGVNNHMGSAVTSDPRAMRVVLIHLKGKGLFFMDSNVVAESVAPQVAEEVQISFTKRDIFIDNQLNAEAIRKQLEVAKRIALETGSAVVIGHDRRVTLQAIKKMVPEFEKAGVRFVLVKELVEKKQ
jgi:polysaccharide deacetylase 2 family uncharacterized protein YibQ